MFTSKKRPALNPMDTAVIKMHSDLVSYALVLERAVKTVIVCANVINLYPDGPDRDEAKKTYAESQRSLLGIVGEYDAKRRGLMDYRQKNALYLVETKRYVILPTSHEVVQRAYANLYFPN